MELISCYFRRDFGGRGRGGFRGRGGSRGGRDFSRGGGRDFGRGGGRDFGRSDSGRDFGGRGNKLNSYRDVISVSIWKSF